LTKRFSPKQRNSLNAGVIIQSLKQRLGEVICRSFFTPFETEELRIEATNTPKRASLNPERKPITRALYPS
jgi:hypothetical protein